MFRIFPEFRRSIWRGACFDYENRNVDFRLAIVEWT